MKPKKEDEQLEEENENQWMVKSLVENQDKRKRSRLRQRMEYSGGKFVRKYWVLENANMDGVKAAMENGVLTVTIPKLKVKKSDVKAIPMSGCRYINYALL
ncbi:hypothetical protein FEM48_Zijuj02G0062800 [Ziziphus jujuba var. spinosa]|uniref:SHSP domain-containing protein n=1 Tax=Ziziphus jujuba var. spinosa TaxID=714518 RepID=A0A978VU42_ZIZJJ|nr:hypothetical protein FEM48_Zijuj02G0062800 [Ziziphus jujuba var. spinosa]